MKNESENFFDRRRRLADHNERMWFATPDELQGELREIVTAYGNRPFESMAAATIDLANGDTHDAEELGQRFGEEQPIGFIE